MDASDALVDSFVNAQTQHACADALDALSATASGLFDSDAEVFAASIRQRQGIPALVRCVDTLLHEEGDDVSAEEALALLGNLLTDVYDKAGAGESLHIFVAAGGLECLQSALVHRYPVCLFACAALQNVTSLDPYDTCVTLRGQGCAEYLRHLLKRPEDDLVSYATAALANLSLHDPSFATDAALAEAIRLRRVASVAQQMCEAHAVRVRHHQDFLPCAPA